MEWKIVEMTLYTTRVIL